MKKPPRTERAPDHARRRFAKAVATALAAAPLAATLTQAQTPPATREATAPPKPDATPTPQQQQPPSPLAVAYGEVARLRFGDKLTPDELARVTRDLEGNVRTGERLRATKLENADEPDFVFNA
ncbi:MAG TPA: hypothetical protein VF546_04310 [Pyrinomonadaceae bacterium]|jgi:hypothetical protein